MSKKGKSKKNDSYVVETVNKLQLKSERTERLREAIMRSDKMIKTQNSIMNDSIKSGKDVQIRSSRMLQTKKSLKEKKEK